MQIIKQGIEIEIDSEADAAYLYLSDKLKKLKVNYTIPIIDKKTGYMINIDMSKNGKIIGIETLPSTLLEIK